MPNTREHRCKVRGGKLKGNGENKYFFPPHTEVGAWNAVIREEMEADTIMTPKRHLRHLRDT